MTRERIGSRSRRYSPESSTRALAGAAPRYAIAGGAASGSARTRRAVTPRARAIVAARVANSRRGRIMWGRRGEGEGNLKPSLISEDRVVLGAAQADRPRGPSRENARGREA